MTFASLKEVFPDWSESAMRSYAVEDIRAEINKGYRQNEYDSKAQQPNHSCTINPAFLRDPNKMVNANLVEGFSANSDAGTVEHLPVVGSASSETRGSTASNSNSGAYNSNFPLDPNPKLVLNSGMSSEETEHAVKYSNCFDEKDRESLTRYNSAPNGELQRADLNDLGLGMFGSPFAEDYKLIPPDLARTLEESTKKMSHDNVVQHVFSCVKCRNAITKTTQTPKKVSASFDDPKGLFDAGLRGETGSQVASTGTVVSLFNKESSLLTSGDLLKYLAIFLGGAGSIAILILIIVVIYFIR